MNLSLRFQIDTAPGAKPQTVQRARHQAARLRLVWPAGLAAAGGAGAAGAGGVGAGFARSL